MILAKNELWYLVLLLAIALCAMSLYTFTTAFAEPQYAYGQFGQGDLEAYLEALEYPDGLPSDAVSQLDAGVEQGSFGDISTTLDPMANPQDAFGVLDNYYDETGLDEVLNAYDVDDQLTGILERYEVESQLEMSFQSVETSPEVIEDEKGHTYIIIDNSQNMAVDPNLVIGLQSQLTGTTQIIVGGVIVSAIAGVITLALRGQTGLLGKLAQRGNSDDE